MSDTYGTLNSDGRGGREVTKTGKSYMEATAKTWRTSASASVTADGRASFRFGEPGTGRSDLAIDDLTGEGKGPRTITIRYRNAAGEMVDGPTLEVGSA